VKTILLTITNFLLISVGYAQCFDERRLDFEEKDSITYNQILDYYVKSGGQNPLIDPFDKGIYRVINYTDQQGRRRMSLNIWIDDRYKDYPQPSKFGYFMNKVFLFYDGSADGKIIGKPYDAAYAECLKKVIADWVYIRPAKQIKYITRFDERTKKQKVIESDLKVDRNGNESLEIIYIFEKDGKVTIYRPA
jgi:hypothetical protein